jgi:hypothetical protein
MDAKKWSGFAENHNPAAVGSINGCLVYFNSKMFGNEVDGFLIMGTEFGWRNFMEVGLHIWHMSSMRKFESGAEMVEFKINNSLLTRDNKVSEHLLNGGGPEQCKSIVDKMAIGKQLNKLLRLVNQN